MKTLKYIKNVSTLQYDADLCTGCEMCVQVCPHHVFEIENKRAVLLDSDQCMECGACMENCPSAAIFVEKGVGCAYAVIESKIKGREEISCGCGDSDDSGGCCGG